VFRRYPRKPKILVLEIVKGGITWMARRGDKKEQYKYAEEGNHPPYFANSGAFWYYRGENDTG
jgi:hypothetical protein